MGTIVFTSALMIIFTATGLIIFRKLKKTKPVVDPIPEPTIKHYQAFLNNMETVLKADLSDQKMETYFKITKGEVEYHMNEAGFEADYTALLKKYGIVRA